MYGAIDLDGSVAGTRKPSHEGGLPAACAPCYKHHALAAVVAQPLCDLTNNLCTADETLRALHGRPWKLNPRLMLDRAEMWMRGRHVKDLRCHLSTLSKMCLRCQLSHNL